MAGTPFLPWEEWLARLLHPLAVALRKWLYQVGRKRSLVRSEGWGQTDGTVHEVKWDRSNPREEVVYSYSTARGTTQGLAGIGSILSINASASRRPNHAAF
jgi:hypothetical protein